MQANTCIGIDVWEGQLEMDEAVLKANGVKFISIRINNTVGGHHLDTGFVKQWEEAAAFVRFPYFVYNPWVDGKANFDWLAAHMPSNAKSVAIDIEIAYSGITAAKYAGEVNKFLSFCDGMKWKTIIYTGGGYLGLLSKWPKMDFWWAQYPDPKTYFGDTSTWDGLKDKLTKLDKPFNANLVPGNLKIWQFSGDYLTLPGTIRKIDVNVFYGSDQEMAAYFGMEVINTAPSKVEVPLVDQQPDISNNIPPINENQSKVAPAVVSTDVVPTNLYVFSHAAYWHRPSAGPLVTPTFEMSNMKQVEKMVLIGAGMLPYLQKINANILKGYDKIVAPDWGPTQGFNAKGLLKFNTLIYPGRNVVRILEVATGKDGNKWGRVEGLSAVTPPGPEFNHIDTPQLIHTVYGSNTSWSYFELANSPHVPLLGSPRWVSMEWLVQISLPVKVTITSVSGVKVVSLPGDLTTEIGSKAQNENASILELRIAKGGVWGRIDTGGWIAVRYNDKNPTNWII